MNTSTTAQEIHDATRIANLLVSGDILATDALFRSIRNLHGDNYVNRVSVRASLINEDKRRHGQI